jgi:hypothetical protein
MPEVVLRRRSSAGPENVEAERATISEYRSANGSTFSLMFDEGPLGYALEEGDSLCWAEPLRPAGEVDHDLVFRLEHGSTITARNDGDISFPIIHQVFGPNGALMSDAAGNVARVPIHE